METQRQAHPTPRQLAALALDKLTPEARTRLQSHVANCSTCADFLSQTPREKLVSLLSSVVSVRSAKEQSTPSDQDRGTVAGLPPVAQSGMSASHHTAKPESTPAHPQRSASEASTKGLPDEDIPKDLRGQSKYRIIRLLGRGGMGSVYEAHHERMDRQVAIKIVNAELMNHPQALQRFDAEIQAVAKLDHQNIARAYDAESFGSLQAIIMEYVAGQTVFDFLKKRDRLSVKEACRIIRQALLGLQHAHEKGITHRDLKPHNLMLTRESGIIKILDFGLAKIVSENRQSPGLTRANTTMGTYEYMAPEQALDAATADIRADIYSLGCTLYYLIAGVLPFAHDTDAKLLIAHQSETPRPLCEVCPEVPHGLSDLVQRMLAKKPADRPQTPAEAAQALLPFAKNEAAAPQQAPAVTEAIAGLGTMRLKAPRLAPVSAFSFASFKGAFRNRWYLTMLIALGVFGGGAILFSGLFKVRTPEGTIVLNVSQPNAEVLLDGGIITVNWGADGKSAEISAPAGTHRIEVKKAGFSVAGKKLTIAEGSKEILTVALESAPPTQRAPKLTGEASLPPSTNHESAEQEGQPIDLLAQARLPQDVITGDWTKTQDGIKSDDPFPAKLKLNYKPEGEFDFRVTFTCPTKDHMVVQLLSFGEHGFGWMMGTRKCGFQSDDRQFSNNSSTYNSGITSGHKYTSVVKVRKDSISAYLDGALVSNLKSGYSDLSISKYWSIGSAPLGIACRYGPVVFHSAEVIPIRDSRSGQTSSTTPVSDSGATVSSSPSVRVLSGTWQIENNELVSPEPPTLANNRQILFGDPEWTSYDFSFQTLVEKDPGGFEVKFHWKDPRNYYLLELGSHGNRGQSMIGRKDGKWVSRNPGTWQPGKIEYGRWYSIRLEVRGAEYRCFVDGAEILHDKNDDFTRGQICLHPVGYSKVRFRDITVTTPEGKVLWSGLPDPKASSSVESAQPEPDVPAPEEIAPTAPPKEGQPIDLLAQVRLPADAISGNWKRTDQGIEADIKGAAFLRLPFKPTGEYDFRITFTRTGGDGAVSQLLTFHNKNFAWTMADINCGFTLVGGNGPNSNPSTYKSGIVNGQKSTALVQVRNDSLTAFLDGVQVSTLKTDYSDLGPPGWWTPDGLGFLEVESFKSATIFHSIEVIPIGGSSETTTPAPPAETKTEPVAPSPPQPADGQPIDLLAQVRLPEDAVSGKWSKTEDGIESSAPYPAKLRLNYKPEGEYDFRITFTCKSEQHIVVQLLSFDEHSFGWMMGTRKCGFGSDGQVFNNNSSTVNLATKTDQKYMSVVRVRKNSVWAYLDDALVSNLKTDYSDLSIRGFWTINSAALGVGSRSGEVVFHSIEVIPINGNQDQKESAQKEK